MREDARPKPSVRRSRRKPSALRRSARADEKKAAKEAEKNRSDYSQKVPCTYERKFSPPADFTDLIEQKYVSI